MAVDRDYIFGFTFEFNQPIEIYIFGATGWPRVVIGLMLIVTFGNFYHHLKYGSTIQAGRVGIADDDEAGSYGNLAAVIKVLAVLAHHSYLPCRSNQLASTLRHLFSLL